MRDVKKRKRGREETERKTEESMDGNGEKNRKVWAVTRLLSLLLFGSEML